MCRNMLAKIDCERARSDVGLDRRENDSFTVDGSVITFCQNKPSPEDLVVISDLVICAGRHIAFRVDK
jgi:hypothetical protein